jgi:WD40 repeat protein
MIQPKLVLHVAVMAALLSAPIALAQTAPVAVIQNQLEARSIAFSPDGKRIATLDYLGRNLAIWEAGTGRKVAALSRVRVRTEISSPDGGSLVSYTVGPRAGDTVVFAPDGRHVAAFRVYQNTTFPPVVWDLETEEAIGWRKDRPSGEVRLGETKWTPGDITAWYYGQPPPLPASLANAKAVSPDGSYAATITGQNESAAVEVWEVSANRRIGSMPMAGKSNTGLMAFSPDGNMLVIVIGHGAEVWKVNPLTKLAVIATDIWALGLRFSPNGRYLGVYGGKDLDVLRVPTWESALHYVNPKDHATVIFGGIAFSPDSRKFAAAHGDLHIWDLGTGKSQNFFGEKGMGEISALAINSEGGALVTGRGGFGGGRNSEPTDSIDVWHLRGTAEPYTLAKTRYPVKSIAFSHDSNWLGAAFQTGSTTGRYAAILEGSAGLWHFPEGTETKLTLEEKMNPHAFEWSATNVSFSPDDKQLVADVFTEGELPVQDCPPDEHCGDPESLPYHVRTTFFDVANGRAVNSTPLGGSDSSAPQSRSFWLSPDGRRAFVLQDKLIPVNTLTGHHLTNFKAPQLSPSPGSLDECEPGVRAFGFAVFSSDVKQVAISDGQQLQILDAKTGISTAGEPLMVAYEPNIANPWQALTAAFSPSGGTLAVAFCETPLGNGQVRLYNTAKLRQFAVSVADRVLTSLAFTPDGTLLFAGGYDGTVRVWETQRGSLVATLVRSTGGEWVVFTPDGLYDASANGTSLLAWRLKGEIVSASDLPDMRLPGLLSKLVSGEHPRPTRPLTSAIANALPHSDR